MSREPRGKTLFRAEVLTKDCFGNSEGDIILIKYVDEKGNIYYYDGFDRWCYMDGDKENVDWKRIISKGKR